MEKYDIPEGSKICHSYNRCLNPIGPVLICNEYNFSFNGMLFSNYCLFCDGIYTLSNASKFGYVYFVLCSDMNRVKIGFSDNPKKRIKTLETSSPCQLETLKIIKGSVALETDLHRAFTQYRVINEWFEYVDEIRKYIKRVK